MSIADYARHRGCQDRAVSVALKNGRITREPDGWIDSEKADRDWEKNTDPRRAAAGKRNGEISAAFNRQRGGQKPPPPAPGEAPAVFQASRDMEELSKARAVRERFAALLMKLDYEEKTGKLIEAAGVTTAAYQHNRMVRDLILAVPDRISAELAAESDAAAVHRMLEAELRSVLDKIANTRVAPSRREKVSYGNVG